MPFPSKRLVEEIRYKKGDERNKVDRHVHKLELIFDWPSERRKISCLTPSLAKQAKTTANFF